MAKDLLGRLLRRRLRILSREGKTNQVSRFEAATESADKTPLVNWDTTKQWPILGIYPSERNTQQPGHHNFKDFTTSVLPSPVVGQEQNPSENADTCGSREYTYLGLDSTDTGPGVHNSTRATDFHYQVRTTKPRSKSHGDSKYYKPSNSCNSNFQLD